MRIMALSPKAMGSSSEEEILPPREWIFFSSFSLNSFRLTSGSSGMILSLTAAMPILLPVGKGL